eukprot:529570-Pyramimonas_sp.AAC.1
MRLKRGRELAGDWPGCPRSQVVWWTLQSPGRIQQIFLDGASTPTCSSASSARRPAPPSAF